MGFLTCPISRSWPSLIAEEVICHRPPWICASVGAATVELSSEVSVSSGAAASSCRCCRICRKRSRCSCVNSPLPRLAENRRHHHDPKILHLSPNVLVPWTRIRDFSDNFECRLRFEQPALAVQYEAPLLVVADPVASTVMVTDCPTFTLPISVSSTSVATYTFSRSAIVTNT